MAEKKIMLPESQMPTAWYNVQADLPSPLPPPLDPGAGKPIGPEALAAIFPMNLIEQEVSQQRWIDIPQEILDVYRLWRPTPLVRADRLEKALGTPARIYYKNESVSPAGSHKPNTAVAQAYYNKVAGTERIVTETGAGQWGSALSYACSLFGIKCKVFMVRVSYDQKPYRKAMMHVWGGEVSPSPSAETETGRAILAKNPKSTGSLGIAISEAIETTVKSKNAKYSLGSVLNHVLMHQTVIGLEAQKQFKGTGDYPDVVIGCCGGGSNFAGIVLPFVPEKIKGKNIRFIGVEPAACPTLTRGPLRYDFGDTAGMTPLLKMHTLGHTFIPSGIHAGGLRYHGMAPIVSHLKELGMIEAVACHQNAVFEAASLFAKVEGIIVAPESAHAVRVAIDEALRCKETKQAKTILFNLSGHGCLDLAAYEAYHDGLLEDFELPQEAIDKALAELPKVGA
ncbi:MAG TPA: TrpB-like pyridoxal phosphate-dependent enzyme [Candidatus Brocadiia bacterium]|nr:TrpB-like pyridoxal phosphate-dependent enzyme [Candidatus Brocadiia bacterium]